MDRLDFQLPEFTRIVWASDKAREIWQTRLLSITMAWEDIELTTVLSGLRRGSLESVVPDNLLAMQHYCIRNRLEHVIVAREGISPAGIASTPYVAGKPGSFRVYVGKDTFDFLDAWLANDQIAIGNFLGYPSCCCEFFKKYWTDGGWRDLIYPMTGFNAGKVTGSYICNILLRALGVRAVFHLPCSFTCASTAAIGEQILDHLSISCKPEARWIKEMLNWPVRWSSLHGVSITTTPILKIISSSDALPETVIVDRDGPGYPEEGVTGVEFPFRTVRPLEFVSDIWSDNGFTSHSSMQAAHNIILRAIEKTSLGMGSVLDIGCGNGLLLEKITRQFDFLLPCGIEVDEKRWKKAANRLSPYQVVNGNLFANPSIDGHQLILISVNRLMEAPHRAALIQQLKTGTRFLIVYSYDSWKTEIDAPLSENFEFVGSEHEGTVNAHIYKPL